jgi:hypothetical protein
MQFTVRAMLCLFSFEKGTTLASFWWTAWCAVKCVPMAKADTKTKIVADGLRYKSKVSGSPFTAATSFGAATMSCFLCGKHRARSQMVSKKILGKSQAVCSPSCKALDEANK